MFNFLLINFLPDDAFYYFSIARNLANGLGSTFDGINPANGYHPLWMFILRFVYKIFSVGGNYDIKPVYVALFLCGLLYVLTGIVLYKIVSKYSQDWILKTIVLILWFLNPFGIYEAFNGLETSLSVFLIALFVLSAVNIYEKRENAGARDFVLIGIVGGLMMLARLDNLLYFVAFLGWLICRNGFPRGPSLRSVAKTVLIVGITATLVVLPWIVWGITTFGTIIPASGAVSTMVGHQLIVQDHGNGVFQAIKAVAYFAYYDLLKVIQQTGMPELFWIFTGVILSSFLFKKLKIERVTRPEIWLFGGFLGIFILNSSIRWYSRSWYFISFNFFLAMFMAWFVEQIRSDTEIVDAKNKKIIASFFIFLTLFSYGIVWSRYLKNRNISAEEMIAAAKWGNENLPEGTKIGVFNAGTHNYFSKHTVVNLDGLVNNNAYNAMREKKLWAYVKEVKLDYIADYDYVLNYRYKSFLGEDPFKDLEFVKSVSFGKVGGRVTQGIIVYKIKK